MNYVSLFYEKVKEITSEWTLEPSTSSKKPAVKGVTRLIRNISTPLYVPKLTETSLKFNSILRESSLNAALFGSFVEYLVKFKIGLSILDETEELLGKYESRPMPKRIKWIHASYKKEKKSIMDVCNLSFSHSILMNGFKEEEATKLYIHVRDNQDYFQSYLDSLHVPYPDLDEKCGKLTVGCVSGVVDMIVDGSIIDIKCCKDDDTEMYRKQLFAYACLHYLLYGKYICRCEIYNFLSGKHYIMVIGDSCEKYSSIFIKLLSSYF